ncbi:MAG: thiamine pyrophosphate-dependent enzyme, partial [Candidatus Thermoplasmatota archaeon]|nr:thiamine pyrophosphate-dependent enzyme [Candidatus Thermoplasmatota archaeon]
MSAAEITDRHPGDVLLRRERFPHIWCPGCGLGNALRCYVEAMEESATPLEKHVVVSGIGCSGRVAGYVNIDSYHTTHGRPIPFATGLKLTKPELEVTVFSGDGDLITIGGNHFIHAARRNLDLNILFVNNFNYGMTGGQFGATTPYAARTTTTPYGNFEQAFNMPLLAAACGAPFVARWTTLHVRQLKEAIQRAFEVEGLSFVEIISPCPIGFGRKNRFADAMDEMTHFREGAVVDHDADLK